MEQKGSRVDHFGEDTCQKKTTRDERVRDIGRHVHIDFHTCQGISSRAKVNFTPSNQRQQGHPVIYDDEEKEGMVA